MFEVRRLPIRELRAGMIPEKDVLSNGGNLILKEETILTETWIERLENFATAPGAQKPIDVRIPRLAGGEPPTPIDGVSGSGEA